MFLTFAYFFLLKTTSNALVPQQQQPKIIGGVPSKGYPPFGSPDNPDCGCTLIHEDIALSAAHCRGSFIGRTIYFGATHVNGFDAQDAAVAVDEILHPQFVYETFQNDIMLIRLSHAIRNVQPAQWNTEPGIPFDSELLDTLGFGDTHPTRGRPSDTLLAIQIPVVSLDICNGRDYYHNRINHETMLCAGSGRGQQDSCKGDSGNPLLNHQGVIMGLVSWGWGCGLFPGVYTRVSAFDDFIWAGICEFSAASPCACDGTCPKTTTPPTTKPTTLPTTSPTLTPRAAVTAQPTAAIKDTLPITLKPTPGLVEEAPPITIEPCPALTKAPSVFVLEPGGRPFASSLEPTAVSGDRTVVPPQIFVPTPIGIPLPEPAASSSPPHRTGGAWAAFAGILLGALVTMVVT